MGVGIASGGVRKGIAGLGTVGPSPLSTAFFASSTSVDSWPLMLSSASGHPGVVHVSFEALMIPRYKPGAAGPMWGADVVDNTGMVAMNDLQDAMGAVFASLQSPAKRRGSGAQLRGGRPGKSEQYTGQFAIQNADEGTVGLKDYRRWRWRRSWRV